MFIPNTQEILRQIVKTLPGDSPVQNVRIGLHWTAVVGPEHTGLASTLFDWSLPHGEGRLPHPAALHLQTLRTLVDYTFLPNVLAHSVGVAALNAVLQPDRTQEQDVDVLEILLQAGKGRRLLVVGHFPFLPILRRIAGELIVLEQNPTGDEYPAEAAPDLVPTADVIAITATTLLNDTFTDLLRLCRPDALVALVGPTAPLSPVFFAYGVDIIAGVEVVDKEATLRSICQGTTYHDVQGTRRVALFRSGLRI